MVDMTTAPRRAGRRRDRRDGPAVGSSRGCGHRRCLALLGMMATHILPNIDETTHAFVPWHQQIAGGRSAALFAVLAGADLALVTGREHPFHGRGLTAARVSIVYGPA